MRAKIIDLSSPDADLAKYQPADPADVSIFIEVLAGPADGIGEETFGVVVMTPQALSKRLQAEGPILGRHLLLIHEWDLNAVREFLGRLFEREEASDWPTLGSRLARYGSWEFEDYRP